MCIRDRLVEALVAGVGAELSLVMDGAPVTDGESVRGQITDGLEASLTVLAGLAMLKL